MTPKTIELELERTPFIPLRLHLVSGKIIKVPAPGVAWLMQNSLLVFQNAKPGKARVGGYDIIALRNIERLEQVGAKRGNGLKGQVCRRRVREAAGIPASSTHAVSWQPRGPFAPPPRWSANEPD